MNDTNFKNALLALGFAADASGTVLSKRFSDAAGDGARAVRPLTASPREVALPQDAKRGNANALDSQTPFVALYASSWNGAENARQKEVRAIQFSIHNARDNQ
ncbi:hypothetical protein FACS1894108_14950 [Planctomycetales bacterium]|nr:hypothetical protein FACS1894108_14950 [Planctomycetales bacterium]